MTKKYVSPQTENLEIGTKNEEVLARIEKLSTLHAHREKSKLTIEHNCIKGFRILLFISSIISLSLLSVSIIYIIYFNDCVSITFGPVVSLSTKGYFLLISLQSFIISLFGLHATRRHIKSSINLYAKGALIVLLTSSLLVVWYFLNKKYDVNINVFKTKVVCTEAQQQCWDSLHETFHCCGWESADDWKKIPSSCCNTSIGGNLSVCSNEYISKNYAYSRGCFNFIIELSKMLNLIALPLSIISLIFHVSNLIVAICIINKI
ncbi:uncharacterized protein [Rhodnius prolixus]|uniref:Tetraspanin n=1 Tax=Rhodnius prolixus TaxID=13249 RepID=T1HQS1_RHOPR